MKRTYIYYFVILISLSPRSPLLAQGQDEKQERPNSSVYKDYNPPGATQMLRPSDVVYQLWEGFMLVRKANDGDPAAQNELGLRYLLGKGFPIDTARAVYWIRRAADQNMSIAQYNLGVFLNNGWGLEWNPFEAYDRFKAAAEDHFPEAEFAMGLMYTDNLVVSRDWAKAYRWLNAAADAKYEPAHQVLLEFSRRGIPVPGDSAARSAAASKGSFGRDSSSAGATQPLEPVYLDFGPDTASRVDDLTLLNEAFREGNKEFRKALGVSNIFEGGEKDTTAMSVIEQAANVGSPEALAVLGRCYERGIGVPRDRILAAEQYLRAARMDSRRALALLLRLVREKGFPGEVESRAKKNDYDAAFVWAGLTELGLDQRILDNQAFQLLVLAADHGNIPSLIELGRCYYTGQWTTRNPALGAQCWRRAAQDGSRDAEIRLAAAAVLADSSAAQSQGLVRSKSGWAHGTSLRGDGVIEASLADTIRTLTTASRDGSMIAQLALGYCYENGVGIAQNTPEAVKLYRDCAQRGSRAAYEALKRMYDQLRPKEKEFEVTEGNVAGG